MSENELMDIDVLLSLIDETLNGSIEDSLVLPEEQVNLPEAATETLNMHDYNAQLIHEREDSNEYEDLYDWYTAPLSDLLRGGSSSAQSSDSSWMDEKAFAEIMGTGISGERQAPEPLPYTPQTVTIYPKPSRIRVVANVLFWLMLVTIAVGIVIWNISGGDAPKSIAGYSIMRVLTDSMQSDIPQGSLIITRSVDANTLEIGDDITYMRSDNSTVTHRIVAIYEDYEGSGQRGFETWGIENPMHDADIVFAENVVGKVVWQISSFMQTIDWIKANWWICLLVVSGLILIIIALKILLKKEDAS